MNIIPRSSINTSFFYYHQAKTPIKKTFNELRASSQKSFPIIQDQRSVKLLFKEKLDITYLQLEEPLDVENKKIIIEDILNKNQDISFTELFCKKPWNIETFNQMHLPTVLGPLNNQEDFSKRSENGRYFLFMDMPIRLAGKGWNIPVELSQFQEVIKKASRFEQLINPHFNDYNVYITIDQREVNPGSSQRRTGWHADSYINIETRLEAFEKNSNIETDSIYLVSDAISTEFCAGPFPFKDIDPNDTEQVLNHFETIAKDKKALTYPPYTLLRMGPECIHQVGINQSNTIIPRTFLKITFSRQILNRQGNEVNSFFDVNWPMFSRQSDKRNHSTVISGYHENLDQYRLVKSEEIGQMITASYNSATKTASVSAYLATPGELLQTVHDGFITTVNVASPGDWKITTSTGTQYFLSSEQLDLFYNRGKNGSLIPKSNIIQYVILKEQIQLVAPWKSTQYLRSGDYLLQRGDEIYGVLREDFESHYVKVNDLKRE